MNATTDIARPGTISESIIQSCNEVNMMREGIVPKHSLNELFSSIKEWSKEEEEYCIQVLYRHIGLLNVRYVYFSYIAGHF